MALIKTLNLFEYGERDLVIMREREKKQWSMSTVKRNKHTPEGKTREAYRKIISEGYYSHKTNFWPGVPNKATLG